MNETLSTAGIKVSDVGHDLEDGVKLATFFQILSGGKKFQTKIEGRAVNKIQKIQNLHIALTFMDQELGVKNPGCSAEGMFSLTL